MLLPAWWFTREGLIFLPLLIARLHPNNLAVTNILLNCFFIALLNPVKIFEKRSCLSDTSGELL
jgi:hypothetical protein